MEQTEASAPVEDHDDLDLEAPGIATARLLARVDYLAAKARRLRSEGRGPWKEDGPEPVHRVLPDIPEDRKWWRL